MIQKNKDSIGGVLGYMKELVEQITNYVPINEQEDNDKRVMLQYIRQFDDCLTRENELFHFTTSAWIVNKERTKVLMVYHNIYHSWSWIGGHADGNPNLLEVVKKEIEEESGITNLKLLMDGIFGLSIQFVKPHIKKGKFVSAHLHYDIQFLFESKEEEPLKIKPDENSDVAWLELDTLLEKIEEEHMKPLYQKLIKKVNHLDGKE